MKGKMKNAMIGAIVGDMEMEFLGQLLFGSYYIKGTVGFKFTPPMGTLGL